MRLMTTNFATATGTTITASSEDTYFPASNLSKYSRAKRWRSTAVAAQWVKFDIQTIEDIDSVVIMWPKENEILLSGAATLKIQANPTDTWSSPAVDVSLSIDNTYLLASHFFTSDQSYRYWRVYIDDPFNPNGYVELGVVWLGKGLTLDDVQNGFEFSLQDLSKVSRTEFGHEYVDEYPLVSELQFSYAFMGYDAVQELENAYRLNGTRKPVMLVADAEATVFNKNHYLIYGKFAPQLGTKHVNYNLQNMEGVTVREIL